MLNNILPFAMRGKPKEIAVYSNDWSRRKDLENAPTLSQVADAYENRFGFKTTASRKVLNDAPQLKLSTPITDIVGVEVAIRRFFRGEDLLADGNTWGVLCDRVKPIFNAHKASDPACSFTPVGAAVIAISEVMDSNAYSELSLEGYLKIPSKKLAVLKGEQDLTLGSPPAEKVFEGGYLFRFRTLEVGPDAPQKPLTRFILIDIRGVFSTIIQDGEIAKHYRGDNPLVILAQRHNKLPTMFR